jgi:hypothetical protein
MSAALAAQRLVLEKLARKPTVASCDHDGR